MEEGDTVAIYLPMIPEAVVAMLSCARIGAAHTVVFGGFSDEALKDRILDAEAKLVITADGGFRRGKITHLKDAVDLAVISCPSVQNIITIQRTNSPVKMQNDRDHWYHQLMQNALPLCPPEKMDAEDRAIHSLHIRNDSKTERDRPYNGRYMVGATMTTRWVFDIKPSDIYWCTADVGWITGHSFVVLAH